MMMYILCPLSLRQVEDFLFERGIESVGYQCGFCGTGSVHCLPRKSEGAHMKCAMKRYDLPQSIVTDRLRPYCAAMKLVGVSVRQ